MWTGQAFACLLDVVILTVALTAFVLWRYQGMVLSGMREVADPSIPLPPAPARHLTSKQPLIAAPGTLLSSERTARLRVGSAYLKSISAPALILAGTYLVASNLPTTPTHFALVGGVMLAAAVPMIALSLAIPFWRAVLWCMAVLLVGAVLAVAASILQTLAASKAPSVDQLMNFVYFFTLAVTTLFLPFLVYFAIGNRRLRGVAPMTFAGLLLFGLASLGADQLLRALYSSEEGTRLLAGLGGAQWLTTRYGGYLLLILPAGWIAWRRLRSLARAYEEKRFSDAQFLARTFWLIFVAYIGLLSSSKPWIALAGCTAAYLSFSPLTGYFIRRDDAQTERTQAPTLLLLRVFGYRARTEQIFDRIVSRWRLVGPATMIAGPDVVARIVNPGDFLRFVSGRTSDKFIRSQADLNLRLSDLDLRPDPDGRYRINDFCCSENSWQATVVALIERADAVVMDLRSLTAAQRGCEFELQQLAARMPMQKVVLITDASTDRRVIEQSMGNCYVEARLLTMQRTSTAETEQVFDALIGAAAHHAQGHIETGHDHP